MIIFKDWTISAPREVIARQYDNLSRVLLLTGDIPEGYTWDMLVQVGMAMDIIHLTPMEGGVGVTLTADQLSKSGYYSVQLRGTRGEEVRHTNVESVFIPASLSGSGQWPTVPSEFIQAEQRIREIAGHPPVPGENGFWMLWDPDADQYVESQLPLPEGGGGGTSDHTKLRNRDAVDQHPMSSITGLEEALEGKQSTGDYLTDQDIDSTLKEAGKAADASAVGSRLSSLSEDIAAIPSGKDGKDGITPTIGENGNWYIGDTDTGKPSRGETGPAGADGHPGSDGAPGPVGATPNIQIGDVETLPAGSPATASMGGTPENPLLNLGIPKGADGSGEGSGTPKLVYEHVCDGTYVSVTDDLKLEDDKIYFTRMTIPIGSANSTFRCMIGSMGNTYTGAVAGNIVNQHAVIKKTVTFVVYENAKRNYWYLIFRRKYSGIQRILFRSG